jgi:hypothetical protein
VIDRHHRAQKGSGVAGGVGITVGSGVAVGSGAGVVVMGITRVSPERAMPA